MGSILTGTKKRGTPSDASSLTVLLSGIDHFVLAEESSPVFSHLFGWDIIELQYPPGQFIGNCLIVRKAEVHNLLKDPVEPVDTGVLAVNGDLLDLDLVRGNAPADGAIIPVLVVTVHG